MFIRFVQGDLPIPRLQVDGGKEFRTTKGTVNVIDQWKRILILHETLIKAPEILTKAKQTVFLFDKHNRRGDIGDGWFDDTISEHWIQQIAHHPLHRRR